jgi:hypothetical protein
MDWGECTIISPLRMPIKSPGKLSPINTTPPSVGHDAFLAMPPGCLALPDGPEGRWRGTVSLGPGEQKEKFTRLCIAQFLLLHVHYAAGPHIPQSRLVPVASAGSRRRAAHTAPSKIRELASIGRWASGGRYGLGSS